MICLITFRCSELEKTTCKTAIWKLQEPRHLEHSVFQIPFLSFQLALKQFLTQPFSTTLPFQQRAMNVLPVGCGNLGVGHLALLLPIYSLRACKCKQINTTSIGRYISTLVFSLASHMTMEVSLDNISGMSSAPYVDYDQQGNLLGIP